MELASTHPVSKSKSERTAFSDHQIRDVADCGRNHIIKWTSQIAQDRGVRVRVLPNDSFVKAASRLSGGVVDLDPVEELLVALARAGVINLFQSGLLQLHYLR